MRGGHEFVNKGGGGGDDGGAGGENESTQYFLHGTRGQNNGGSTLPRVGIVLLLSKKPRDSAAML